jgi:hypothetical protein
MLQAPTAVMTFFAFLLLASLGYVWVEVILEGRAPALELAVVAVGLVLSFIVLGGIVLDEAGIALNHVTWSCLLVGFTLVGDVVLVLRYPTSRNRDYADQQRAQRKDQRALTRYDLPALATPGAESASLAEQETKPGAPAGSRRRISTWQAIAGGLAVLIAGSAVWIARAGAISQHNPGFTELSLSSIGGSASTFNLGVIDHEGKTERYKLVLLRKGHVSATWELVLADGRNWQKTIHITGKTRANLYLLPNLSRPYRYVDTEP